MIDILLNLCFLIEIWHVVFYSWFYHQKFKHIETIVNCANDSEKLYKSYKRFAEAFASTPAINQALESDVADDIIDIHSSLTSMGIPAFLKNKILNICDFKDLLAFLMIQFVEVLYVIFLCILGLLLPSDAGTILIGVCFLLSFAQSIFNKDKTNTMHFYIDTMICVLMFSFYMAIY